MTAKFLLFLFVHIWAEARAQHSPYSLQAAVDALHRRETQLALKDNFSPPPHYLAQQDEDYWEDEPDSPLPPANRLKLNKLLARYLARENDNERGPGGYDDDFENENYLPEEKKRSFFREREEKYDTPYQTVFREREQEPYDQSELAEQFLREIEKERELEREEKYKETLKHLWEKYQQQENEIEQELFNEEKKKHPMAGDISPYYVGPPMERKRSYPVLPWLPANRKKRFPVTKRSPPMPNEDINVSGTDVKVPKDLQELFGQGSDEKKKRSTKEEAPRKEQSIEASHQHEKSGSNEEHIEHGHHKHHHESNDGHESDDSEEHEHEHEHDHDEDEDDHDFDDEDDEDRKKKREISSAKHSNQEIIRNEQVAPANLDINRAKKSIEWSKYFGLDRKKKSDPWFMGKTGNSEVKKRSPAESERENKDKKQNIDPNKLDNMDHKLKVIEDLIIGETIKYTGAHEGISDPNEIRRLKDHVVSRLATAYSLEKMRRALEKLRQSVDDDNHLTNNEIEPHDNASKSKEKEKRVAVKKEKVEYDGNHAPLESKAPEKTQDVQANNLEETNEEKKKKKRNGFLRYSEPPNDLVDFEEELGAGHFEQPNDGYNGLNAYGLPGNSCPLLDSIADRCRGVDVLSGDVHQELLPICGIHQICYLCGTSQVACDLQFLSDADSYCGHNNECQSAARNALMILRGTPGPQMGPKECLKNPCLYRVMREIGL